ncbi:MAG TPA: phospho-N-acetylmuramoyl-pentapeptide-transferase [Candidatus Paceibacterota bacterium]
MAEGVSIIGNISLEGARVLATAVISFAVALIVTPLVLQVLKRFNFGKQIRASGKTPIFSELHKGKEGTPTMGGVIIWGTVLFLAGLFFVLDALFDGFFSRLNFINRAETYLPIAALLIAALMGIVDDLLGIFKKGQNSGWGIGIGHKIFIYIMIAVLGAWWFYYVLDWNVLHIPFWGNIDVGWWYIPIFMFIMVASAFSANETDGLDGLLGGVSLFAFSSFAVVAFALERYDLASMSAAVVGAILAFLWFNIYPAKFFMGDTGSMALGITMGMMAMLTNTLFILPFFAIILVIESTSVIIQKISKKFWGRKIFLSTPIHHHFEAIGWPESQVTMRFWIISIVFSGLGLAIFFLDRLS